MNNITLGIIKFIGLVAIWWAIPFRAYARSVVYNYVLENNKTNQLSRLWQRDPKEFQFEGHGYWRLHDIVHNVGKNGYIKYRKVNKFQFWFILITVWIWLDDDSNHDTTDLGYIESWYTGERKNSRGAPLVRKLIGNTKYGPVFGNSFDLGDIRAEHPYFNFWCTFFWNLRNLSMNYQYMFRGY